MRREIVEAERCRAHSRRGVTPWSEGHRCGLPKGHVGPHRCGQMLDGPDDVPCPFTWGRTPLERVAHALNLSRDTGGTDAPVG